MLKCLLLLCTFKIISAQFEVPDATVEVFSPRGLKVSIPDQEGIKLFAFHGKINEEFNGREGGYFSRDILKAKEGRWTFYDPTASLKIGDVLYFWTYVDYFDGRNKLGYPRDDQKYEVAALIGQTTTQRPTTPPTPVPVITTEKPTDPNAPGECKPTITLVGDKPSCAGKLIFNEEFKTLRRNFWKPEVKFAGMPDYEFTMYQDRPEVLNVKKSRLVISPVLTESLYGEGFVDADDGLDLGSNCTGASGTLECVQKPDAFLVLPPVTSAQITTKNSFVFTYGRVEVRAKLPKGDWIYPELYLSSKSEKYGPGYESGQIKIAFLPGNEGASKILYGGCVLGTSVAARNYGLRNIQRERGWNGEFHKYWVKWTSEKITVGVDETVYGNIYPPEGGFASEKQNLDLKNADRWKNGTLMAPFDRKVYLTLGVGVGGHCFEDRTDGTKPWRNNDPKSQKVFYREQNKWKPSWGPESLLEVDYVKVFAI